MRIFKSEPVVILTALGVLLSAILQFLITGGVITVAPEQQQQLDDLIKLVITIVVALLARSQVSPVGK